MVGGSVRGGVGISLSIYFEKERSRWKESEMERERQAHDARDLEAAHIHSRSLLAQNRSLLTVSSRKRQVPRRYEEIFVPSPCNRPPARLETPPSQASPSSQTPPPPPNAAATARDGIRSRLSPLIAKEVDKASTSLCGKKTLEIQNENKACASLLRAREEGQATMRRGGEGAEE